MGLSASSTTTRVITLTLRILTAVALIVSLVLLAIIQQPMIQNNEQKEIIRTFTMRFYDVVPFRYTAATIIIGIAYSIFQFVCALVRLAKGNDGNIILDFYGEEVMSKLLASGAVAGFVGSTDMVKNWWDQDQSTKEVIDNFINRTYPAHALVLLTFLFSFVLSVISSYALANRNNY